MSLFPSSDPRCCLLDFSALWNSFAKNLKSNNLMNQHPTPDETDTESTSSASECCEGLDQRVRRNPSAAVLIAAGTGLAIALLVRALRPEPTPQRRLAKMLGRIEDRLHDLTAPVLRKASALASDGMEAAQEGGSRAKDVLVAAGRRVRGLFS